jgi:hypothetical protein
MRKRNIQIIVRLNAKEQQNLAKQVKKSGLSQEGYLRSLINGCVPKELPPPDYFSMPLGILTRRHFNMKPTGSEGRYRILWRRSQRRKGEPNG